MEIATEVTRVRAAKTSGECRKNIADASQSLGVAANIRSMHEGAVRALKDAKMNDEQVLAMLGDASARIREQEKEAARCLDAVLNAIGKVMEKVKDLPMSQLVEVEGKDENGKSVKVKKTAKLLLVRELFETMQSYIPQTAEK